jgi:hypothetical protein
MHSEELAGGVRLIDNGGRLVKPEEGGVKRLHARRWRSISAIGLDPFSVNPHP